MAAKERADWHLTPEGWILGTVSHDFGTNQRPVPLNRVLTVQFTQTAADFNHPLVDDTHEIWRAQESETVEQLLGEFGPCPKRMS